MAQFSLSWDCYKQNICQGLTALQQNGEFVDMTIAADGHHVKVHQMVMSLVSPYIKDLISSAQCPHPVIFLNKVSYSTLLSILEYVYTGEVIVNQDNLDDLVQAGRELHIKGLEDMKIELATQNLTRAAPAICKTEGQLLSLRELYKIKEKPPKIIKQNNDESQPKVKRIRRDSFMRTSYNSENDNDDHMNDTTFDDATDIDQADTKVTNVNTKDDDKMKTPIQYTLSNQGSVQMIVNRYLYNLRYTSVKNDGTRRWQCTNYTNATCKAAMSTKGGVIISRSAAHNHPYHDKQILKRVKDNLVFTALNEAEEAVAKKQNDQSKQGNMNTSQSKRNSTDREDTIDANRII